MSAGDKFAVQVDGRDLTLTNLAKVLYPADGFTKAEVLDYYQRISVVLLPHVAGRPMTLKRYPDGVGGESFFAKHAPAGRPQHIAVVVMENHEYGDIIGSRAAPFINSLARRYALATQMYGITHPSLPNYLALTGGSTFGISSDCTDCNVGAASIVDQLQSRHLTWRAYLEGLPRPCFQGADAGRASSATSHYAHSRRGGTRRLRARRRSRSRSPPARRRARQ